MRGNVTLSRRDAATKRCDVGTADYRRQSGDVITIDARDDVAVESVEVTLRDAVSGVTIEQGRAERIQDLWHFAATAHIAGERPLQIEVAARDHPGNRTTRTIELPAAG